jgi:hypothetical protein
VTPVRYMKMRATAILAFILLAASAAHAEDSKLIGKWNAVDPPGKSAEFHEDGAFEYAYELGAIPTVLRSPGRPTGSIS